LKEIFLRKIGKKLDVEIIEKFLKKLKERFCKKDFEKSSV
jgi:hypothetical protein